MALISWNDKMNIGIASIDSEHRRLVEMLNTLYDAVQSGKGREALGPVLDGLISYTAGHFKNEERLFAETGYPDAAPHKQEHDDLTRQVLDVQAKYKSGASGTLSLEVMNFLKNWLIKHIQGSDKKYGPHLTAKGIR